MTFMELSNEVEFEPRRACNLEDNSSSSSELELLLEERNSVELDILECDLNYKLFIQMHPARKNQHLPSIPRGSKKSRARARGTSQPATGRCSGKENLQPIKYKRLSPIDVAETQIAPPSPAFRARDRPFQPHVAPPPTAPHNHIARNRRFAPPPRTSDS